MVLVSLTAIIWVTQALRDVDLMTNQGQTILVFIGITSLVIPSLIMVIAPMALVIAMAHVLNKLAADSEIIVMNAAGMSPWRLFRAFLAVAMVVSLMVLAISAYAAPECLRQLRRWATSVRADLVTNIVQPGRFTTIEQGLIFHIRERQPNGVLLGIFVDDRRDPKQEVTFLADQGEIVTNNKGTFLVLQNGNVQRHPPDQRDPTIVHFESYAFDLSRFQTAATTVNYSVREHYLWELAFPDPANPVLRRDPAQVRAEFHDRLLAPIYPIAFTIIAFAYLGAPSTTRQSRTLLLVGMLLAVSGLRFAGFASNVLGLYNPIALAMQYLIVAGVIWLGLVAIARGMVIEPPAFVTNWIAAMTARLSRRFATS